MVCNWYIANNADGGSEGVAQFEGCVVGDVEGGGRYKCCVDKHTLVCFMVSGISWRALVILHVVEIHGTRSGIVYTLILQG